jgi:CubicO group peptidase (beta-lactamase class C family)
LRIFLLVPLSIMLSVVRLAAQDAHDSEFGRELWELARGNGIPGVSAAIVRDQQIVWAQGFGLADIEKQTPATEKTLYRLASVSKPFAAVLLMQLVDQGKLDLDAPMREFAIHPWFEPGAGSWAHYPSRYLEKPITVRHVITHTSEADPPGSGYNYSGNIFGDLTYVIEDVLKESYPVALQTRVLDVAGMHRTLPGQLAPDPLNLLADLAAPYKIDSGAPDRAAYPAFGVPPDLDVSASGLEPVFRVPAETEAARRALLGDAYTHLYGANTAAGMVSNVVDLARFDIALDRGALVSAASRSSMFTAAVAPDGTKLPYGLGWFVEEIQGETIVWHFGWFPPTVSALYVKVPGKNLTFILCAVTDLLSAEYSWTDDGVRASPYARLFFRYFGPPQ